MIYTGKNGRDWSKHDMKYNIAELPFSLKVYRIIDYRNKSGVGAKFIAKSNEGDFYLFEWTVGGSERFHFFKINFDLYLKYLKADISYRTFVYDSLVRDDEHYLGTISTDQFQEGRWQEAKPIFKEGNDIKLYTVRKYSYETMPSHLTVVPFQHKDKYPEFDNVERQEWSKSEYVEGAKRRFNEMDRDFLNFIKRESQLAELLS